jgi:hypothetical protein
MSNKRMPIGQPAPPGPETERQVMCFNATSSFIAAAVLVPIGIRTVETTLQGERRYLTLAAFPLLFGIQQALEGLLWLNLAGGVPGQLGVTGQGAALGFLFFAYLVWPGLVPFAAWRIEDQPGRRRLFGVAAVLGGLLGASLFVPLIVDPDWLRVTVIRGSIQYEPRLIYEPYLGREVIRAVYAVIVAFPLVSSSATEVRRFGALILASVILSALAFSYAFVSIWCFFAALLSAYLGIRLPGQMPAGRPPRLHAGRWRPHGT